MEERKPRENSRENSRRGNNPRRNRKNNRRQRAPKEFETRVVTINRVTKVVKGCLLYTSPSPRDRQKSRMPSSA